MTKMTGDRVKGPKKKKKIQQGRKVYDIGERSWTCTPNIEFALELRSRLQCVWLFIKEGINFDVSENEEPNVEKL